MKVPTQISVGGKRVRIEYVAELTDADGTSLSGELICGERRIRISKSRHMNERDVFSTIFHELTHLAFEISGHSAEWTSAQEEPLVYCVENLLADLLVFRPGAPIRYRDVPWPGEDE